MELSPKLRREINEILERKYTNSSADPTNCYGCGKQLIKNSEGNRYCTPCLSLDRVVKGAFYPSS